MILRLLVHQNTFYIQNHDGNAVSHANPNDRLRTITPDFATSLVLYILRFVDGISDMAESYFIDWR